MESKVSIRVRKGRAAAEVWPVEIAYAKYTSAPDGWRIETPDGWQKITSFTCERREAVNIYAATCAELKDNPRSLTRVDATFHGIPAAELAIGVKVGDDDAVATVAQARRVWRVYEIITDEGAAAPIVIDG